ncbi:MAG: Thioredoxin [Candidatus Collierbacteria bacterium GW2011_GWF2_44_15]|uniref:Thioredoxin n=4 Tax=Candidatus Collieribacteriota TaxID=1752725 RepID=A0A0G1JPX0_9BACT|nr:MAG: Thioredoxin [Candidatus Collierbacteria bacterium GW2011_GWA1_44_12]KKT39566.1 MAG: Thioredoxin [Candidatus Collierbacteria bacterium GW2011_GWF1_44_12]KKT46007.1 MAG: Thioredoxin [Candidatus Collierbacteria bacterium GW2011_GWF2_44_15]KKU29155.1 MAG: Thioredoxin [Candidatus Collierbacteria bacterium GW2011_GWE1_46_18]
MALVHFTDQNFDELVLKNEKPVLVDFYADWCGPCRMVSPIIEELAKQYEGKILVGKVDVDANPQVAGKYGVMSIPTVVLFNKGEEVQRQVGYGGKEMYDGMVKKLVK